MKIEKLKYKKMDFYPFMQTKSLNLHSKFDAGVWKF